MFQNLDCSFITVKHQDVAPPPLNSAHNQLQLFISQRISPKSKKIWKKSEKRRRVSLQCNSGGVAWPRFGLRQSLKQSPNGHPHSCNIILKSREESKESYILPEFRTTAYTKPKIFLSTTLNPQVAPSFSLQL